MWSRRKFIFSTLTAYSLWAAEQNNLFAYGKKNRLSAVRIEPRLLATEYWPPAVTCNFIDVFDGNLFCQADEFGRLAVADIGAADPRTRAYPILGETSTLGDKVLYLKAIQPKLALAIVWNKNRSSDRTRSNRSSNILRTRSDEKTDDKPQDGHFACVLVNLALAKSPLVVSKTVLPTYFQLTAFTTITVKGRPILCVAGVDFDGKNRISFYGIQGRGKLRLISSIMLAIPIKDLVFADMTLLVLHDVAESQASLINLNDPAKPQFIRTVKSPAAITEIASYENTLVWAFKQESDSFIAIGDIKTFPQSVNQFKFTEPFTLQALAINNKYAFALGNNDEESVVVPFVIDKNRNLVKQIPVSLTGYVENSVLPSKILFAKDNAYISSGWAGVQMLSADRTGKWAAKTCFSIQKLPIIGCTIWSNYLLMAADDLSLYDITNSKQPKLINTTKLPAPVKTIAAAGSYILCLDKSELTLRKIENPGTTLATLSICADNLSFDRQNHKAYLIQSTKEDAPKAKKEPVTNLVELNVYNNSIEISKTFRIIENSYCSSADEGHVAIGNLDGLAIYKPDEENKLICQRSFKDLAWREIILSKGSIFATAIDQNVNGYFLTMTFDGQEISLLSTIKIPNDAVALTVGENVVFAIGQNSEGHSLLTTIDISNMSKPKILSSKPAIESASTITLDKKLAIVAGQGFQIFSL